MTMTTCDTRTADLLDALKNISDRLEERGIASSSPLGIWLLATYQSAVYDDVPESIRALLGMDTSHALDLAREIIHQSPNAVNVALASWSIATKALRIFELTEDIASNHFTTPNPEAANEWVKESTLGLIEELPFDLDDAKHLFASAVATDVKWKTPFAVKSDKVVGKEWKRKKVLVDSDAYVEFFSWRGNPYAVFPRSDESGTLTVYSFAALNDEGQKNVQGAACAWTTSTDPTECEDLELDSARNAGSAFYATVPAAGPEDVFEVAIPSWAVQSTVGLDESFPEFRVVAEAITGESSETLQSVVAEYDTFGFKAAAVTATITRTAAFVPVERGQCYRLDFSRPFAVIAAAEINGADIPLFEFMVTSNAVKEPTPVR